jgi:hypothetical protein
MNAKPRLSAAARETAFDVVAAADAAMYQSKRLGDGTPIIDRHESPACPYSGIL